MRASVVAQGAVVEGGAGRGHRRRGVRHVVGHDLVGVDAAVARTAAQACVNEVLGQLDRLGAPRRGSVQPDSRHGLRTLPVCRLIPR